MPYRRHLGLFMVLIGCMAGAFEARAQDETAPADSYQFNQPIPVVIRMANNGVVQTLLVGIDAEGLSVITPQGRQLKYAPKKVRSVRSVDGAFFYAPAKDDLLEVVKRLNALQPQNLNQAGVNGVPGQPAATGAHAQPIPTFPGAGANSAAATSAQMMAHAQAGAANPTYPATTTYPTTTTYPSTTTSAMPSSSHSAAPYASTYTPPTSSMGAHSQMPNMHTSSTTPPPASNMGMSPPMGMNPGMGMGPQTMGWEYECQKCHHKFTSSVEIKAGHRCTKCGVVWGQVKDEHGRVTSSSPAARIGGGVGAIVMVIGVIVAIVRKVQAA